MSEEGMKILAFTNGTASHIWRFDPLVRRFHAKTPHQMAVTNFDQWNDETLGADIIILEMISGQHQVDTAHNLGAKVIYEADDAVIDSYGEERKNLMHLGDHGRKSAIETIRKCDAITVTNQTLAENYARFTDKPIYVLPIYMDYEYYGDVIEMKQPERNTDEIRIGWFGSKGHFEDLRMILPAVREVLEKHDNVKFVYCGYGGMESDRLSQQVQWGEDVFKEIPRHRREFHPGAPAHYWKYKHRFLDLDIGLCPLVDDYFNKNKVATKWLEYSALETPSICSPTVYGDVVKHNETGFIANTVGEWTHYMNKLIEDAEERNRIGQGASKEVFHKHNFENHWKDWERAYLEVLK